MSKFQATYYFDKEFFMTRYIEAEDKEMAMSSALPEKDIVQFEALDKVLYRFSMSDVKMISINEIKNKETEPRIKLER